MIFIQRQYQYLASDIATTEYSVVEFENKELSLSLEEKPQGDCFIIGSLTASPQQALELLLLIKTVKLQGAKKITLISPYYGYQRQDNEKPLLSQGLNWADALLFSVAADRAIVIDAHNPSALLSLKIPVINERSTALFHAFVTKYVSQGFSFVFPDQGAAGRHKDLHESFPSVPFGFFLKKRMGKAIEVKSFQGSINKKVIIYDDILDSGETLLQICMALKQMHVQEIVVFVTHAFFHGRVWNELWSLGVRFLYCSNSTPQAALISHPNIHVVTIKPLLEKMFLD